MTEHDIEERVKSAFTSRVPDVLDNILSECDLHGERSITMTTKKSKNVIFKFAVGIAALVLAFAGVLGVRSYRANYSVASTISLDVNPSIEVKTNQKEIALEVNALNEDGRTVIGEMELEGSSIDVVVNALVGSMLRNGYLNDASNSILVSVYGENGDRSLTLQEKLTGEITELLNTDTFNGAVISQTITPDNELQTLAETYGISLGKARLIREVIAQRPECSYRELSELTINELNLMSKINGIDLNEVQIVGSASEKAYIGVDKAKEVAFSRAGVISESNVSKPEIEMDHEHGVMIYEVSFVYNDYKYNYDIDACSGAVLEAKSNPIDDKGKDEKDKSDNKDKLPGDNEQDGSLNNSVTTSNNETGISSDRAKEIAFSNAGVSSESAVSKLEIETDQEHGTMIYEVSFVYNDYKYNYDIDACNGAVLEAKSNPIDDKGKDEKDKSDNMDKLPGDNEQDSSLNNSVTTSNSETGISSDRAKEIAFSNAGVSSESAVSKLEIETDQEHGTIIYEVSFFYNDSKYNYDIDAYTGAITETKISPVEDKGNSESKSNDKEQKPSKSDKDNEKNPDPNSESFIGETAAKAAALYRAGLNAGDITEYKCETYIQKGTSVYKIKFISGEYEYSCDVDAGSGDIVKFDKQSRH